MREYVLNEDKPRLLRSNIQALSLIFNRTVDYIGGIGLVSMRRVVGHDFDGQLQLMGVSVAIVGFRPPLGSEAIGKIPIYDGHGNRYRSVLGVLLVFTLA